MNIAKKTYILFFVLLLAQGLCHINAQDQVYNSMAPTFHNPSDWTLAISPAYANHPEASPRFIGSFDASLFLGKHVSLNANFTAGRGYLQFGLGIIGIPLFSALLGGWESESIEEFLLSLAIVILSFENLNFHVPVSRKIEISPYFSLLRIKTIQGGYGKGDETSANFVLGSRINFFTTDRFFVSPFAETTRDWGTNGRWGVNGGVQCGFYFYARQ